MLREIRAEPRSIFRNVAVDSMLIGRLISDAIPVLRRARKGGPHESTRREQLDDVPTHVGLVRGDQIRPNERGHFVCNHLKHSGLSPLARSHRFSRKVVPVEQRVPNQRKVLLVEIAVQRIEGVSDDVPASNRRIDDRRLTDDDIVVPNHAR